MRYHIESADPIINGAILRLRFNVNKGDFLDFDNMTNRFVVNKVVHRFDPTGDYIKTVLVLGREPS